MTLGEEILEVMQECIKIRILEDRILEIDMKEVGVGLEKGHIQITSEGTTEVIVGQGQDQEWELIETELDVMSIESMIILQKIVQQWLEKKERQNKYSRCLI